MKKNVISISLLSFVVAIILFIIFNPVLQHPNSFLYSTSGDALKSYFNFSYYLKYDGGIRHDGINYPYGDHLQYINSHPLYLQILKFIDTHICKISDYGVAILNLTMIFSLLFAAPFIFLILRKFLLPHWYAFFITLFILFLTPQFDRIHGHFEMVYAFFIPLFWYLLIRYREGKNKFLWAFLLVFSAGIGGFTSAYYVAFYSIFILGILLGDLWLMRKNLRSFIRPGVQLLVIAIIPLILVRGVVGLTDWVEDRPTNPYGFFVYHANVFSVFQPFYSPLKNLIGNYINLNFQWEGRAYVGFPATIVAIIIVLWFVFHWSRKQKTEHQVFFPQKEMNVYLIAATLILLFSMCFPFKWGFGALLNLIPPVKQFRALGRFSWIFYYVFSVYTAWFVYSLFLKLKAYHYHFISVLLLIFVFYFWTIDAGTNIKRSTHNLFNKNDKLEANDLEYSNHFKNAGIDPNEFQAILFLPFANTCGDKLLFEKGMNAFSEAMKCSYRTGIPLIQSFSPRLSFSNALSSIQMLADSCIQKTRIEDMNDKPILLVTTNEPLTEQETWIKSKSRDFWSDKHFTLSVLPIDVFETSYEHWLSFVRQTIPSLEQYSDELSANVSAQSIFYDGFEEYKSDIRLSGNGAFFKRRGEIDLYNKAFPEDLNNDEVEISFWLYVDTRIYDMPQAFLRLWNEDNSLMERIKLNTREVHNVYGNWVRISISVVPKTNVRYQLSVKGKYITVDDLLIRPHESNVCIRTFNLLFFNNYPFNN